MSAIVNLALLETLKAGDFRDEIDLYIPYLAISITELETFPFGASDLSTLFKEKFGFRPPEAVIKVILTRAKTQGLVRKENHMFVPNMEKLIPFRDNYDQKKRLVERAQAEVISKFQSFAVNAFQQSIDDELASTALLQYIEMNIVGLLLNNRIKKQDLNDIKNISHLTASFIADCYQHDDRAWGNLLILIKGVVLAGYMFMSRGQSSSLRKKNYENMTVYLDTPLLLGVLGFNGKLTEEAVQELVNMLSLLKINLKIFDKTLDELESLFYAWARDLNRGAFKKFNPATLQLLKAKGFDGPRLETEAELAKSKLEKLGINVQYGWKISQQYQCDEVKLEQYLIDKKAINSNCKKGVIHDVTCISKIFNSRCGELINDMTPKFSIFVTSNTSLVKYGNQFFQNKFGIERIPLLVSDTWITTVFWLKHQNTYSELPARTLVSSAFATLNRSDASWDNFLSRLERMQEDGDISQETYESIRFDKTLLKTVNDTSVAVGEEFSNETVYDVISKIEKRNLIRQQEAIKEVRQQEQEVSQRFKVERDEFQSKHKQINENYRRVANRIADLLSYVFILFLSIVFTYAFIVSVGNYKDEIESTAYMIAQVIVFLLSTLALFTGWKATSVRSAVQQVALNGINKLFNPQQPSVRSEPKL